jgi:hypothetical protein
MSREEGKRMETQTKVRSELGRLAQELYEKKLRPLVETPENIGKIIVMDVDSGDYEIDEKGVDSSLRLRARHPNGALYALRIGYKTAVSFSGVLERAAP